MSDPKSPRATNQPKTPRERTAASSSGSKKPRAALKSIGDVPGAFVSMVRESRSGTEHVVDAISEASAPYEHEIQASLMGVRERLRDSGLDEVERRRLEVLEGELLDRLHAAGREKVAEVRGAHQDFLKVAVLGMGGVAFLGAVAVGNKEVAEKFIQVFTKVAPRAISS